MSEEGWTQAEAARRVFHSDLQPPTVSDLLNGKIQAVQPLTRLGQHAHQQLALNVRCPNRSKSMHQGGRQEQGANVVPPRIDSTRSTSEASAKRSTQVQARSTTATSMGTTVRTKNRSSEQGIRASFVRLRAAWTGGDGGDPDQRPRLHDPVPRPGSPHGWDLTERDGVKCADA